MGNLVGVISLLRQKMKNQHKNVLSATKLHAMNTHLWYVELARRIKINYFDNNNASILFILWGSFAPTVLYSNEKFQSLQG